MKSYLIFGCLAAGVLAAGSATAHAQTVYEPVQYQYGAHQEIFYGGTNGAIMAPVYLPAHLAEGARAQRYDRPVYPYPTPFNVAGPGTAFVSPYMQSTMVRYPVNSFIYSDYLPYSEVGQYGYTIDDARNEAYSHVPRYQTGVRAAGVVAAYAAPAAKPAPVAAPRIADPREKALPLINWAKNVRGKNVPLYNALMTEARKYDAAAVAAAEKGK